jgi:PAS domain S-box-containing protein
MNLQPLVAGTQPESELFRLMANSVQDYAIFLLDPSGKIASWNNGARLIKQYEAAEIIGQHFSVFYTDQDNNKGWPEYELSMARETGRLEDEGWRVRKDGSRFWANVIITPLRDDEGRILAYSKITRDLTERKRYEENLRLSEERFRLLVEGVQDYAIYLLDPEGYVTSWNTGANRIKGYEDHEIIGSHFSKFYSLEDVNAGKPDAELAMARVHGRAEDEGWRIRKNGSRFWARVVVTALHDSAGKLHGFAKVTQDLTQRRHAEAMEFARQNINEFIAVLAHELRNPLAPIRSAVHLMLAANQTDSQNAQIIRIIDRQSGQLIRIVDDILDVSRITRGNLTIDKDQVATPDFLTRAVEAARPGITAQGHTLVIDTDNAPPYVTGDEIRLAQAVTNILNNACRYTPRGGTITLKVFTAGEGAHKQCVISIKDTGEGIDPAFIRSIFGLFVQGPDKRKIAGAGLGVGLALARSIIELHQGSLTASSEGLGKGSEFVIQIPVSISTPKNLNKSVEPATQTARILVVDDNADAAFLLTSHLSSLGHDVATAYNGEEAIQKFESHVPHLVLLDIGMPGMNGLELTRRLRAMPNGSGVYIVAVTGWGKPDDELRSKEAGIDLHLVKPVEPAQLNAVLELPSLKARRNKG